MCMVFSKPQGGLLSKFILLITYTGSKYSLWLMLLDTTSTYDIKNIKDKGMDQTHSSKTVPRDSKLGFA
jgi:hypothetical protein